MFESSSEQTEMELEVPVVPEEWERVVAAGESYPLENRLLGAAKNPVHHLESPFVEAAGIAEDVGQGNPSAAEGGLHRNSVVVEIEVVVGTAVVAAVAAEIGSVVGIGLAVGTGD